jgi:hypothetical protein
MVGTRPRCHELSAPNWIAAQRDFVTFENLAVIEQRQRALALHDHDSVGFLQRAGLVSRPARGTYREHEQRYESSAAHLGS